MRWLVYGLLPRRSTGTYDGKGSRALIRWFATQAEAHRFAQHIVESGACASAEVKEID